MADKMTPNDNSHKMLLTLPKEMYEQILGFSKDKGMFPGTIVRQIVMKFFREGTDLGEVLK